MSVLFFVLWIILNGRITLEIVLFGLAIAAAVRLFSARVIGEDSGSSRRILRNLPLMLRYALVLIAEILKASAAVMGIAFSGSKKPEPCIVEFHSGFDDGFRNTLLANSITLTPGTYTIFLENDRFVIHCLRREYAEGMENSRFVQLLRDMR
ncbi:MAG: Na+/H+ antiporter subunit E [Lachnospiraceae bacterium]|nr:Na+/H+ antiporter subunit E [Lachnospiraceae bacterium]